MGGHPVIHREKLTMQSSNQSIDEQKISLNGYFQRLGYSSEPVPNLHTLREIVSLHSRCIPFENLDPLLKKRVHLDLLSLQKKLIESGRGGYCYEHNLLLKDVLSQIGFTVSGLAARVLWQRSQAGRAQRSHMILRVVVDGTDYLVDVGFGGLGVISPLRLFDESVQSTELEDFRIRRDGDDFILEVLLEDWESLYRFDLSPFLDADYETLNWAASTHPDSPFPRVLMAAFISDSDRHALLNNRYQIYRNGKLQERKEIRNADELRDVLHQRFGIILPDTADLDALLHRLCAP